MSQTAIGTYDLLIIGAGPAGCAAAIRGRMLNLSVALVEREPQPRTRACGGWIGAAGVALASECGVTPKSDAVTPFAGVRLRSWDLKRHVDITADDLQGWLVDRARFDALLAQTAQHRGANLLLGAEPASVTLGETHVTTRLTNGREVLGRILLIADGVESRTARLANLPSAGRGRELARCVHYSFSATGEPGLEVVFGAGRGMHLGTIVRARDAIHATFLTRDASSPAAAQAQAFVAAAQAAGVLPRSAAAWQVEVTSAAGAALDTESHVGKRTLLIGDAGGFVSGFSNEGIYPAMKSGWLAAETAARALAAPVPQDELATFGSVWRAEIAEYLRLPNTDLSLLLPLVFSNAQMSKRVARAFLLGAKF